MKSINQYINEINIHEYKGYKVKRNGFTWTAGDENRILVSSSIEGLYKLIDNVKK